MIYQLQVGNQFVPKQWLTVQSAKNHVRKYYQDTNSTLRIHSKSARNDCFSVPWIKQPTDKQWRRN